MIFIANWKSNGSLRINKEWCDNFKNKIKLNSKNFIGVAPSYIHFQNIKNQLKELDIKVGAQDVDAHGGARTGSINIDMLSDLNCDFVIIGHSERRLFFGEDSATIKSKLESIYKKKILPIVCVGESYNDNKKGKTHKVLESQLIELFSHDQISQEIFIAYEPIWAIGTGLTPNSETVNEIHQFIKDRVQFHTKNNIIPSVLYGGSVTTSNIKDFSSQKHIDGVLVGGASLDGNTFADLVNKIGD